MSTQWPLNKWIMEKLAKSLTKEGCETTGMEPTIDGLKLTFTDAFGFVYQLDIKTISRIENNYTEVNLYDQNAYKRSSK